jgi:hypothetical protein
MFFSDHKLGLRVDRGWGLEGESAAVASRVIRGLLADHIIGALGVRMRS